MILSFQLSEALSPHKNTLKSKDLGLHDGLKYRTRKPAQKHNFGSTGRVGLLSRGLPGEPLANSRREGIVSLPKNKFQGR